VTTKIAAGVVLREGDGPAYLERFVGTDVARDPKVAEQVKALFARHGVKSVVVTSGNVGCAHEEGIDFPVGKDCPFCPFWAGKQGTARRDQSNVEIVEEFEEDIDDGEDEDQELDAAGEDDEPEDEEPDEDDPIDRVDALLGDAAGDMDRALDVILAHLRANLQLPCEVTGMAVLGRHRRSGKAGLGRQAFRAGPGGTGGDGRTVVQLPAPARLRRMVCK